MGQEIDLLFFLIRLLLLCDISRMATCDFICYLGYLANSTLSSPFLANSSILNIQCTKNDVAIFGTSMTHNIMFVFLIKK